MVTHTERKAEEGKREEEREKIKEGKEGGRQASWKEGAKAFGQEWQHYKVWRTLKGLGRVQRGDLIPTTHHLSYWRNERSPSVTVTGSSGAGKRQEKCSRAKFLCHRELMVFPSLKQKHRKRK